MNMILILLIALLFRGGIIPSDPDSLATVSMAFVLQLQISAVLLNLLPVPPLDGFQAIAPWMQEEHRSRLLGISNVTFFGLFIALAYVPPVNEAFWDAVFSISNMLGVPAFCGDLGHHHYMFWRNQP